MSLVKGPQIKVFSRNRSEVAKLFYKRLVGGAT